MQVLVCAAKAAPFQNVSKTILRLALAEGVEVGEELGEADGCGFGSLDFGVACGAECGDGEGHGDAVVAA